MWAIFQQVSVVILRTVWESKNSHQTKRMNMLFSRKPKAMQSSLVALTLIALAAAAVASGADANSPGRGEPAASSLPSAHVSTNRVVVWDGEQVVKGTGWVNHETCSMGPQTVEAHSGNTALEFKFKGAGDWLGAGWNWCAFQTGPYGTDITAMKKFTFWIKSKGKTADLKINLLCNGLVFDMPKHHTEKVSVLAYCPQLSDGQWHQVSIPLADLKQPKGFDPLHVGELQMFNAGAGDGSFFFDDLAFE
jgi:hypothetical protein